MCLFHDICAVCCPFGFWERPSLHSQCLWYLLFKMKDSFYTRRVLSNKNSFWLVQCLLVDICKNKNVFKILYVIDMLRFYLCNFLKPIVCMPSVVCVFYFCDFKYEGKCEFMIAETIKFCLIQIICSWFWEYGFHLRNHFLNFMSI